MGEIGIALQMAVAFIGLPWTCVGIWLVVKKARRSASEAGDE